MATTSDVISSLGQPLRGKTVSMSRQVYAQMKAKQVPKGGTGGGRSAAHYDLGALASVILGTVGAQPSDAVEAVKILHSMEMTGLEVVTFSKDGSEAHGRRYSLQEEHRITLGSWLENFIDELINPNIRFSRIQIESHFNLELCLSPASAVWTGTYQTPLPEMSWPETGLSRLTRRFGGTTPGQALTTAERVIRIPFAVLLIAADLWRDTKDRAQTSSVPSLAPATASSFGPGVTTASENETPEPHHRAPAPRTDQPRDNETGHTHRSELNGKREKSQLPKSRRTGRSPSHRSANHVRTSHDHTAPT